MFEKPSPEMIAKAEQAMSRAYSPYSNVKIGACIKSATGKLYSGCNVENASYPLCQCAEANAIVNMVVSGEQKIAEIVVFSHFDKPCSPCGGCRQQIQEFSTEETLIHLYNRQGWVKTFTIAELLPFAFRL